MFKFNNCQEIPTYSCIYKISCLDNNKVYIGSAKNLKKRIQHHLRDYITGKTHCTKLLNCFRKYGEDAFNIEILEKVETYDKKEIEILETLYVLQYNSIEKGLNIAMPGTYKRFNEEEVIKRVSKFYKAVIAIDKDTSEFILEFKSVTEAANYFKTSTSNISGCCQGKVNYLKGCVFVYKEDYDSTKNYSFIKQKRTITDQERSNRSISSYRRKYVYEFDLSNNLIQTFNTIKECENYLGLNNCTLAYKLKKGILVFNERKYSLNLKI